MNIFDMIALVVFFLTVIICTFKGLLKIVANFGSLFFALIASKWFGVELGEKYLGDILGDASGPVGVFILFILLFIVCRIIFGLLAKLITKVLKTKGLDRFLGMLLGVLGGLAFVYLLGFAAELIISVVSLVNSEAAIISTIESSVFLECFMK